MSLTNETSYIDIFHYKNNVVMERLHNENSVVIYDNNNNNNNNHFFSANIFEDRAQWRDKTKGLSRLVVKNNA